MNKRMVVGAVLASLVVGATPSAAAPVPTKPTNLVVNGGFEEGLKGWYAEKPATLTTGQARTGARAMCVMTPVAGPAVINDVDWSVPSTVKGATYTATAYVKKGSKAGAATTPVTMSLKEFADGKLVATKEAKVEAVADRWTAVTTTFTAATEAGRVGLTVGGTLGTAKQSLLVDDVSVELTTPPKPAWTAVYRNDFVDMRDVNAFQSSATVNGTLKPSDTANSPLQKPSLKSNTAVVSDERASDGKALGVFTRKGTYATPTGTETGWTNGRMSISGQDHAAPVRIKTRLRMTASARAKSAVMWWPAGGGWPWEVDFAETFGGTTTTDYWGSRQYVGQRWHADLDGDGQAIEQLIHDDKVDATAYHVYELVVLQDRMWIEIDGVKTFETTDARYLPKGAGFFTIGKALTGRRDVVGRTDDAVVVDWLEISKPTP